jgi:type II secretory pathway pseudopilin PulG
MVRRLPNFRWFLTTYLGGGQRGVALLEVLVAGVVLGIAVVGLAAMFSSGQSFVVAEGDERVAIFLAQQKIEQLRAAGFGCIPGTGFVVAPECPPQDYNETPAELGSPRYSRITTVQCVDPSTFDPVACPDPVTAKRITVTVTSQMAQADSITVDSGLTLY